MWVPSLSLDDFDWRRTMRKLEIALVAVFGVMNVGLLWLMQSTSLMILKKNFYQAPALLWMSVLFCSYFLFCLSFQFQRIRKFFQPKNKILTKKQSVTISSISYSYVAIIGTLSLVLLYFNKEEIFRSTILVLSISGLMIISALIALFWYRNRRHAP
jgi:hypothetical protein